VLLGFINLVERWKKFLNWKVIKRNVCKTRIHLTLQITQSDGKKYAEMAGDYIEKEKCKNLYAAWFVNFIEQWKKCTEFGSDYAEKQGCT
jgi:hypothetical protein